MLELDSAFPGEGDDSQKLSDILDYLSLLREQLRYEFANLDIGNFNEKGLGDLSDALCRPFYARIDGIDGEISEINSRADSFGLRLTDAEGDIGRLTLEAQNFTLRLESAEGNITQLLADTGAISLRVENAESSISQLTTTVLDDGAMISSIVEHYGTGYRAKAAFILSAINGQSTASLSADRIDFTGTQIMLSTRNNKAFLTMTDGSLMIDSTYFKLSNTGALVCSDITINGGEINLGRDGYNTVFSVSQNGTVSTRGRIGLVGRGGAELDFFDASDTVVGKLSYTYRSSTSDYALYLQTSNAYPLKLYSSGNMSIDTAPACTLYIGTAVGAGKTVTIGNSGASVNLVGTVKINGRVIT